MQPTASEVPLPNPLALLADCINRNDGAVWEAFLARYRPLEAVAPADYFAPQQLLYMFVTAQTYRRLTESFDRLRVEFRQKAGPA